MVLEEQKRLMRIREVADITGVCVDTIRRWVKSGQLPVVRLSPKTFRIDRAVLDRILSGGTSV